MMETLLERTQRELSAKELDLSAEATRFIVACDNYAAGAIEADDLQLEMCRYIDRVAQRSQAMSRAIKRTREPPLADFFTEATNMVVDAILRSHPIRDRNATLMSEKSFRLSNGKYIKPDVSIWCGNKMVAVVECKTTLSFSRDSWLKDYDFRAESLFRSGLKQHSVLMLVATDRCWSGFSQADSRTGKVWFSLCPKNAWPGGGKTGELTMAETTCKGVLQSFINTIHELIV